MNMDPYTNLYMRYLGVLKLLEEASPYVTEEIRETIERAHADAVDNHSGLVARRILDRCVIEVDS